MFSQQLFPRRHRRVRCRTERSRPLSVESLEGRELMAAQIDRIQFSPALQNVATDQYVELRGPAGETLQPGTYFLAVNSVDNNVELGDIYAIFD